MDLPESVDVDLSSSVWALGVCGVLALLIVCSTCVVLSIMARGRAPEVLRAFADVISAFRRRPRRGRLRRRAKGKPAPRLEKAG